MFIIRPNKKSILLAGRILRAGGVIVYPTDTAYALGGVFNSKKVSQRILRIKKRKDEKFTLIASSPNQVKKFFTLNQAQIRLVEKYWPGPLSLVVSKKYAVRVPDSAVARKLARLAGKPLIATSANIHGEKTPYSVKKIAESLSPSPVRPRRTPSPARGEGNLPLSSLSLDGRGAGVRVATPDLILDAGTLPKRKTSTIVEVSGSTIKIIRQGAIHM